MDDFKLGKSRQFIWNLNDDIVSRKEFTFANKKYIPKMKKYRKYIEDYNSKLYAAGEQDTSPNNFKRIKFWNSIISNLNELILRTEVICNVYDISKPKFPERIFEVYKNSDTQNLENDKIKIVNNKFITPQIKRDLLLIMNKIIVAMRDWK
jgi:hypothetical protein